ncbi:MAG: SinR family protein [Parcubacteria group bacterium GW2011_GWC1_43_12]|nr:MAG: SinR family protein [Parcubacteria group bacterium GW2011_GWB1_42_6]KKS92056.1 MAG: SinR family protein [Parcubacteria group bacterium GW2011_GWC1_43_12]
MVYLISYRLNRPGQDYKDLYQAIQKISGTYWHHTTSAWLVESNLPAKQIYDLINPHVIDVNDELIIFRLQGEYYGRLAEQEIWRWLSSLSF